jgi:hypothetical protein
VGQQTVRTGLALLVLFNAVCMLGAIPLFSMATGAGKLFVVSTYRELDLKGLRNPNFKVELDGRSSKDDWGVIPEYFSTGAFEYTKTAAVLVATAFAINTVLLLLLVLEKFSDGSSVSEGHVLKFNAECHQDAQ